MYNINITNIRVSHQSDIIEHLLKKNVRIEPIYHTSTFYIDIETNSIIPFITRKWWEHSYLMLSNDGEGSILNDDAHHMIMPLTLSEAVDYIHQITPPLLQSTIPSSIQSLNDIREILSTYLMESHGGNETLYRSKFQNMTMLYRETNQSILNEKCMKSIQLIRDHVHDGMIAYALYVPNFQKDVIVDGIYVFHCMSMNELERLMTHLDQVYRFDYHILDYKMSAMGDHYVTIELTEIASDEQYLTDIVKRSYAWIV